MLPGGEVGRRDTAEIHGMTDGRWDPGKDSPWSPRGETGPTAEIHGMTDGRWDPGKDSPWSPRGETGPTAEIHGMCIGRSKRLSSPTAPGSAAQGRRDGHPNRCIGRSKRLSSPTAPGSAAQGRRDGHPNRCIGRSDLVHRLSGGAFCCIYLLGCGLRLPAAALRSGSPAKWWGFLLHLFTGLRATPASGCATIWFTGVPVRRPRAHSCGFAGPPPDGGASGGMRWCSCSPSESAQLRLRWSPAGRGCLGWNAVVFLFAFRGPLIPKGRPRRGSPSEMPVGSP